MKKATFKKAFTMIELIFVIIILGIVSSIGSEIIANVYEQYIIQRAQHRASLKTELAAIQIANRLAYAIPGTIMRRIGTNPPEDINDLPLGNIDNYTVLQWVGADMDSFKAISGASTGITRRPGWSGFCDVDNPLTTASTLTGLNVFTPGSNLTLATTIIGNLSRDSAGLNGKNLSHTILYFPTKFALVEHNVFSGSGQTITLDTSPSSIVEQYKLAWTSYALVVTNDTLRLHYNFSPSRGVNVGGTSQVLLRNVSTFKFKGEGRTIRFKICVDEQIGENFNITSCKEKAVF